MRRAPREVGGLVRSAMLIDADGVSACYGLRYREPQVPPPGRFCGFVGAAPGLLSQYMRVVNTSEPWLVSAALRPVRFTEYSVGEYRKRRGTLFCVAFGPGLIVAGWHVRRHSAHAVPPS